MSGIIAGYLPHLPPTPGPTGEARISPIPVPYQRNETSHVEKRRMGAPPKPVTVGEQFGCWRVIERAENHPKDGVQATVECIYCGARSTRIVSYLRRDPPNTHNGCLNNRPSGPSTLKRSI
jgi:hypothetical protein